MSLNTASEVISFVKKLEEDGAKFYKDMAQQYTEVRETFLPFAEENQKNIVQIERAYYGVISDAIEGCFSFNINSEEYTLTTQPAENASYSGALNQALETEKQIIKFYSDAAEQSKSLLADVPRVFVMIVKKRNSRMQKLELLLGEEGA
ncbi:hypothetical protein ACFLWH_01640 [Chloroflexota bacterium]